MRVLLLTWDVTRPGSADADALALAGQLAGAGADVEVLLAGAVGPTSTIEQDGLLLTWVGEAAPVIPLEDIVSRVLAFSVPAHAAAVRRAAQQPVDVVLAVGWQTAYVAAHLRESLDLPVVATLASTEVGRVGGDLEDPTSLLVHQVEWWLTYEARRVIAGTRATRREVQVAFHLPGTKVDVIGRRRRRRRGAAYVGALSRAIAEERELREQSQDEPPLRPVLVEELELGGAATTSRWERGEGPTDPIRPGRYPRS